MSPAKRSTLVKGLALAFAVAVISVALYSVLGLLNRQSYTSEEEVRAVASSLERAVLERDEAKFLNTVDPKDENFMQEQKQWFNHLEMFPAHSFTLQLSSLNVSRSKVVANLSMAWSLEGQPGNQTVTYEAAFIEREGRWFFSGPNFQIIMGKQFVIHYYPQHRDLANAVIERLDSVLRSASEELNYYPKNRINLNLYPDEDLLKSSINLAYNSSISGWTEPGESIKIVIRSSGDAEDMKPILAHEITHSLMYEMVGGHGDIPWWLDEGVARYASTPFEPSNIMELRELELKEQVSKNMILSWSELADKQSLPQETYRLGYVQGWSFVSYVTGQFGRDARNSWLKAVGSNNIESATLQVFGMTFQELDSDWRSFIAATSVS